MPSIEITDELFQKLSLEATLTGRDIEEVIQDFFVKKRTSGFVWADVLQRLLVGCTIVNALHPDFPVIYVNAAFESMSGYKAHEVIGRNSRFLQNDDRDQPGIAELRHAIKNGLSCQTRLRNYRKDGTLFWNQVTITPIHDLAGKLTQYIGIHQDITEIVNMAEELKVREDQYKTITELMSDYAFSIRVEPDGTLINEWVTGAFEQITGFKLDDMGEKVSFDQTHPDDVERVLNELDQVLNNQPTTTEYRIKTAHEDYIWLRVSRTPVWDNAEGRVVRFLGASQDITSQKEAELALKESETRFRQMANNAPVMIWMADETRQCTYVNQIWLDFRGRTLEQEVGLGWTKGIHPDDVKQHAALFTTIFEKQDHFLIEYRLKRHDGVYRWIRDEGVPRFTGDGKFIGFVGSCVDVTEIKATQQELENRVNQQTAELREEVFRRKQAELELKHERDLLQNMILTSPSGIMLVDLDGKVKFASQHVDTILKVERKKLLDDTYMDVNWKVFTLYGDEITQDELPRAQVIKKKQPLYDQEMILEKEDGTKLVLSMNLAPLFNDKGEVSEIVMTIDDITMQKEWEASLQTALEHERQLNMLKSQFISTITHEFKTPLTVIRTSTHLLRQKADQMTKEDQLRRIDRIDDQVTRLNNMVDDIVQLNRTGSYGYQPEWDEVDLKKLINDIVDDLQAAYEERVIIKASIDLQGDPYYLLDHTLSNQIISNLLSNAIKYSHEGGEVHLNCHTDAQNIIIKVSDSGIGIPKSDQPFLFNDFFRARNVETRPGIGFGLTIVRQAVKALGGELLFESQENVGTTFTIILPIKT